MTAPDPIARFSASYARAIATLPPEANPTAVVVSTVGPDGRPSSRYVLLKDADARGFVFYTNLRSRKGREMAGNPQVALCFYWAALDEQIRVEGRAEIVTDAEADAYFATRPRDSQIGAWASDQSAPLSSTADLTRRFDELSAQYAGVTVPRPPHWTGVRVVPERIEFWHSRPNRLHDRELYERDGGGWRVTRLNP